MLSLDDALTRTTDLCALAKRLGADAADAIYSCDASSSVEMRLGKLEDVQRAEGQDIALRVFIGQQSATVSSADLSSGDLNALVERAIAMAREAPADPYAGLAPEDMLFNGPFPDLDLDDGSDAVPEVLRDRALAAEDAARAVPGVTNSEGGGASHGRVRVALATSHGFAGAYGMSSHMVSASVIAGEGDGMERDYDYSSARHASDLDDAAAIGKSAGERAVRRLNAGKAPSGQLPIIFDPRVGSSLLGHLAGAISGSAIARRTSFLLEKLGEAIFAANISVLDDPHRIRGLRSRAFDGEGLQTKQFSLIDKGVLTGWIMDSAAARQLGLQPTGHAARGGGGPPGASLSNVHLAAGSLSPTELMADIADGVYVTELIGQGANPVTGDYSRGAAGFRIEKGEITSPIAEFTIAGNLIPMFAALVPANDLEFRYATNVPTLRIDGMTIAGG
jgi:PmbA protein